MVLQETQMTLQEIVNAARRKLNNYEVPYLWIDEELVYYCNEVINNICREALVFEEQLDSTACEIITADAVNNYALDDDVIYVTSAKVVTKELITLSDAPAADWEAGDTITGGSSSVTSTIDSKLTDYKYIIYNRSGAYTAAEILTNGTYTAGQDAGYPIVSDYESSYLKKKSITEMVNPDWQADTADEPIWYMLDYKNGYITLYPTPDDVYTIRLGVYKYPATAMTTTSMSSQTPTIAAKYHPMIVDGIVAMAFMKHGEQTFNEKMASIYNALFNKQMSDLKRKNLQYKGLERTVNLHKGFM